MHPLLRCAGGVLAALLMLQSAEQRGVIDLQAIAGPRLCTKRAPYLSRISFSAVMSARTVRVDTAKRFASSSCGKVSVCKASNK